MSQYCSYQNPLSSKTSVNEMEKCGNNIPKRSALSCINGPIAKHNVLSKNNIWRLEAPALVQSTVQPPEAMKFPIFEDKMHESTPDPSPKECKLPQYVMKLYKEEKGKENTFWSFPDPPQDMSERQETEERWTAPFRGEVHQYMKAQERKIRPNVSHIRAQADISAEMRTVLVDWMIEVGEEYNFQEETVHLAVSYTDRFLSTMSVVRSKLQLVGTTALFIASKYHEIYAPELSDFVYITDNTYTKKDILRMEQVLLMAINFVLAPPTAHSFLQVYSSMASSSETVTMLAQYICDISMLDMDLLVFLPSEIGAGCLALANYILDTCKWSKELAQLSGYTLDDIKIVIMCLFEKYHAVSSKPQKAVYDKYKSSKYQRVACIQCPSKVKF